MENQCLGSEQAKLEEKVELAFARSPIFNSTKLTEKSIAYDLKNNRVIIAYSDVTNNNCGTIVVGVINNDKICFESPRVFSGVNASSVKVLCTTNNKIAVIYQEAARGLVKTGSIRPQQISFGPARPFNEFPSSCLTAIYDAINNKIIITYQSPEQGLLGVAVVGTVKGLTVRFGSRAFFGSACISDIVPTHDAVNNKIIITYSDNLKNNCGTVVSGIICDTIIHFNFHKIFHKKKVKVSEVICDTENDKAKILYIDSENEKQELVI